MWRVSYNGVATVTFGTAKVAHIVMQGICIKLKRLHVYYFREDGIHIICVSCGHAEKAMMIVGRFASFILCVCLVANVTLGCAGMLPGTASLPGSAVTTVQATDACSQSMIASGKRSQNSPAGPSFCKAFCATLIVEIASSRPHLHETNVMLPATKSAAVTWDSSVDPPHPRALLYG